MTRKNLYVILFFLLFPVIIFSQPQQVGTRIDKLIKVIPPSPEAASLGKYGEVPVGLFTGVPQISIPLYSLKEGSIEIPVAVSYHSRGIKVSEVASSVGLGWSLNAGGVITRTVRGKPDESTAGYFNRDLMMAPLTIPFPGNPTNAQYASLESLAYGNTDLDPDIFSYNFLGRSGRFFFDHNKNIHLITPEDIIIEVNPNELTTWTIKDESGNKYIFAVTEETTSTTSLDTESELFTSSWYLTTIVTKEGRQIDFHYSTPTSLLQDQLLSESDKYRLIPQTIGDPRYTCPYYNGQIQRVVSSQIVYGRQLLRIETTSATVFFVRNTQAREDLYGDYSLAGINVLSKFTNTFAKKYFFSYDYFQGTGSAGYGGLYNYPAGGDRNKRLKLLSIEDVTDPGQGALYKFYYDETLLPNRDSYAQDHWGYYNGATSNTTMLPQTDGLPYGIPYGDRSSSGTFSSAGVLNKIEYPTGGQTNFTYEPNQTLVEETYRIPMNAQVTMTNQPGGTESTQSFTIAEGQWTNVYYYASMGNYPMGNISPQLIITDENNTELIHNTGEGNLTYPFFFAPGQYLMKMISPDVPESNLHSEVSYMSGPITHTINKIVGGVRIKQTTNYDPVAGNSMIRKYEYPATALLTGPRSSNDYLGNALEMAPCTAEVCPTPPWNNFEYKCDYLSRSSASKYSFGDITGGHVAYQNAKEIYGQNGENGYSESFFSYSPAIEGGGFPYSPALVYDSRNGLLLNKKDYNSVGVLVQETTNAYQFDEKYNETSVKVGFLYDNPYHDSFNDGFLVDQIAHVYYNIISETAKRTASGVTQYDPSGNHPISSGSINYYDHPLHSQITRIESMDSKGNSIITQLKYPHDFPGNPVYAEMLNRNILTPIEEIQTNITIAKELSRIKTNYQFYQNNTQVLPATIESSVSGNLLKTDVTITAYDTKGNVQEFTSKDGIVHSLIWGYGDYYPVAKIMGKGYNDAVLQSGINMTIVNNPADENSLRTELNKLRTLSGTLVTTLTYKPLIGLSSETDASGKTRYYEYDNQGRLSLIRDLDNNIIRKVCYNFAGQPEACPLLPNPVTFYNVEMSQVFTRNNCPSGQTGSQVTFTVQANSFSSTISLADANQQAQNEINANGQAYANTNGTCTQNSCTPINCNAPDKKCINGVCETGVRINYSSVYKKGVWTCYYYYQFSDNTVSQNYSETSSSPCVITEL